MSETITEVTRAEYCAIACADIFSGAGEIMASPMATLPLIGARLARLTTEPDLLITDGEALIFADTPAVGAKAPIEGWMPFRKVFDVVASGRRHVVMGANQIDRHGNQNLSAFGPLQQPTRQMFGVRGAPGNTINHPTSYWVGKHTSRVFCDTVDIVSGVGYDQIDPENPAYRFHHLHRVVSNLGVFDFGGPDHTFRALSLHPGVTADQVADNTSFEVAGLADAGVTREPTDEELRLIREVLDPRSLRDREVSV
ncbi:probable CoA-transferase beta subunit [Rhodococcus jostii RHA1]|uniref:Cholesterol ring-cleaving hydrolase IpdB subunit n=2 Tax=Rhodococcus TaxID=1827 RepID=IPDB_RHOJR|nr:cholesterol ring-cleaving hydrolase subunit IpdB [Rhodococcus jostii]Q0S7Q0.1 RecName: Full=Cholesterol ring-cleaving hydrolase IpdB subunit; AltName: Full=(3E)-2-(2-carboxylatoethyl)-3-methyl-6-oxocyclohex-1-ene-1-carboxyl-CoA hydrolase beta subunit; Short=COCHEA-CoA hydrolase beta subunit [Rhodococcus jostii RHA1]6CO6_B Chain B, Probable CoA-transferase beta subunit [Rhodococcus jostii RHA1]6CO9_B Chain B, Probable CoA-transferase beta subunit [Rhodococcus jostii RHA1]6COJ_B Chain B, Proba